MAHATDPFAYVREWDRLRAVKGWWHSFELPDGTRIEGVSSIEVQRQRIEAFPIPADLKGKRVLDIGTWDGWFAFEMERRGAEVVAVDCWDNPRFREMHQALDSRVDYRRFDMYELTPERIGKFDIVLFMGVLYHLKHPLLALERVCALATDFAAVESFILRETHRPGANVQGRAVMEFYETDELGGQTDNWCGPSLPCLLALCRTAGFARVEEQKVFEFSACVACYRSWQPPEPGAEPGPELLSAYHNMNYGINFESRFDEYVTCAFRSPAQKLEPKDVKPEVDRFGVKPIKVERGEAGTWRAHFKLPPGLGVGWHDVRVRLGNSRPSNEMRIAVDLPLEVGEVAIRSVADGRTWKENELNLGAGDSISVWVQGLPENADVYNVRAFLNNTAVATRYVGPADSSGATQVNLEVSEATPAGPAEIRVEILGHRSAPAHVEILPRGE
jgi:tRNA (mo5U34)-methyltransferase